MHLHHRLLEMGHSHRKVVLVLYMWVSVVAFGAVGTYVIPAPFVAVAFGLLLVLAVALTMVPIWRRRGAGTMSPRERRHSHQ